MYYVYAIASENRKYVYIGLTSNLENRLKRHNSGYEKTTKPYFPYRLIYHESVADRVEARKVEKGLKSRQDKRFLYAHIRDNFPDLTQYIK